MALYADVFEKTLRPLEDEHDEEQDREGGAGGGGRGPGLAGMTIQRFLCGMGLRFVPSISDLVCMMGSLIDCGRRILRRSYGSEGVPTARSKPYLIPRACSYYTSARFLPPLPYPWS